MSAYSTLEDTLKEILVRINPSHDDWVTRFQIINELRGVVGSLEVLRGATVEPFGSFVSNLYSRWGDLDISIDLSNGSFVSSSGKKHKQNLLRQLLKAMRQKGGWHSLQFIPNARVPILKVESNRQNISCDISIDNLQGQMKSKFLFWINEIDGRFRDMVLLVKEWAKAHNINNPKAGTFNSYSLSLLVVFHFQTCVPAIFPPLQDIYPGNIADDLTGLRADAEKYIAEICAANIIRFRSDKMRAVNRSSLSELFISFLGKFSDISLKASNLGICTYRGQWEYIESNTRWLPKTYVLFVEDPFEQPQNTARAVNSKQLSRISEAFESTYRRLISVHPSQNSLLSTLVQPKTLRHIPIAPVRNHSHYAGYDESTNPQWQRSEHLQLQNQSSNGVRYQTTHPQLPRTGYLQSQNSSNGGHSHYAGYDESTNPQWQRSEHLQLQNRSSNGVRYQTTHPQLPRTGYLHSQNSSNGGRHQPSPQTHTVMNSSQVHPQFQNVRHEGHHNNTSTSRPPQQTYYNQGKQRRWRPRSDK